MVGVVGVLPGRGYGTATPATTPRGHFRGGGGKGGLQLCYAPPGAENWVQGRPPLGKANPTVWGRSRSREFFFL